MENKSKLKKYRKFQLTFNLDFVVITPLSAMQSLHSIKQFNLMS